MSGIVTTCGHCHTEYPMGDEHDCEPNCLHCGATFDDLDDPEYDSEKIAVSRHQRECDERPEGWGENIRDPEAEFRAERRERERRRKFEERLRRQRRVGL